MKLVEFKNLKDYEAIPEAWLTFIKKPDSLAIAWFSPNVYIKQFVDSRDFNYKVVSVRNRYMIMFRKFRLYFMKVIFPLFD